MSSKAHSGSKSDGIEEPWVDKHWFYREYWGKGRSLTDIADESSRAKASVKKIMQAVGVPMRSGGTPESYAFKRVVDRQRLFELYWRKGLTIYEIADKYNVSYHAVHRRMDEFDPPIRKRPVGYPDGYDNPNSERVATPQWNADGYKVWNIGLGSSKTVKEHRITAIGEYGLDAVKGKHVHHTNSIRWLNVPNFDMDIPELESPNLEPLGPIEHARV